MRRIQRVESDVSNLQHTRALLRSEKRELEQDVLQARSTSAQLMVTNNQLSLQLKASKDEVSLLSRPARMRSVCSQGQQGRGQFALKASKDEVSLLSRS